MPVAAPLRPQTLPGQASAKRRKWGITLLAQIAVWQLIAILVVESVLFLAGLGEEEIFKLDDKMGFTHMPNKRVTWRSEGYSKSYFNEDGMREPGLTVAKPTNTMRIALLGDSMVEALQVPIEKTFGYKLQQSLSQSTRKPVQVLNFATSGYSTAQEFLQLKEQVLKYEPDLVLLCYNSRDLFENWAPPDQTLTNVRPYALHLPGQPLVIDSSSVTAWSKSPRGRFLKSIEWIREHSRIWGLIAAWEIDASFHNPVYRAICAFLTQPGKTIKSWRASLSSVSPQAVLRSLAPDMVLKNLFAGEKPSFSIRFFEDTGHSPSTADSKSSSSKGKTEIGKNEMPHSAASDLSTATKKSVPGAAASKGQAKPEAL
ncbi:MAG TPA: SGNH/GDSL hydrolase family protein, partial [Candidatus Obscuribacterales bacterium]